MQPSFLALISNFESLACHLDSLFSMRFFVRVSVVVGFLLAGFCLQAQNMGSSPYSQLGIGDVVNPAFGPHQAMGSAGVAYSNGFFINNINPALLARNRSVVLELGVAGQYKRMTSGDATRRLIGGNLNYLAIALPIARYWTSSVVLSPTSSVNYDISTNSTIAGTGNLANYRFVGRGGLSSVSWNNGFSMFKNRFYLGLQTSYVFGATTYEFISKVDTLQYSTAYQQRINASGFNFKPGVAYRGRIRYNKADSLKVIFLNVGATYDIASNIGVSRDVVLENRGINGDGAAIISDTLVNNQSGKLKLPGGYRIGFNIEKPFHWAISADFYQRNWSDYHNSFGGDTLRNAYGIGLGAEWTPDINSVNSYLKRMTFRAGVNYSQMPLAYQGKQLTDRSVSFGVFLPITPQDRSGVSYINTTFILGQRGDQALLKENYFRVVFGFSINAFDWFRRYRVD